MINDDLFGFFKRSSFLKIPQTTLSSLSSYVSSRPEKYTRRDARRRRSTAVSLTRACVRLLRRHRSWKERTEETILLKLSNKCTENPNARPRPISISIFLLRLLLLSFFPPPFSRGRWRRRRVSGRYLTTTDVNSFTRAQNRSLYS